MDFGAIETNLISDFERLKQGAIFFFENIDASDLLPNLKVHPYPTTAHWIVEQFYRFPGTPNCQLQIIKKYQFAYGYKLHLFDDPNGGGIRYVDVKHSYSMDRLIEQGFTKNDLDRLNSNRQTRFLARIIKRPITATYDIEK